VCHIALQSREEAIWNWVFLCSRIIFGVEMDELLDMEVTKLVIKIYDEGERSDAKQFEFFGLAVYLQIFNQQIFTAYLMIELEMVYHPLPRILRHFFEIVFFFVKNPLYVSQTFTYPDLMQSRTLQQ
jgi:hypothetical protein